jgi:rhodanese-related sulfurtransferase
MSILTSKCGSYSEVDSEWVAEKISSSSNEITVIDVRGPEREGGFIPGSWDIPHVVDICSLIVRLQENGKIGNEQHFVVFTCMFSQLRGPANAKRFILEQTAQGWSNLQTCVLKGGMSGWVNKYNETRPELIESFNIKCWERGSEGDELRHMSEGIFNRFRAREKLKADAAAVDAEVNQAANTRAVVCAPPQEGISFSWESRVKQGAGGRIE